MATAIRGKAKKKTVATGKTTIRKKAITKTEEKKELKKDIAATYNHWKTFEGQQYTGMKVGRTHKWYYDKGIWRDKKITPDKWEIDYAVVKRRAGRAPEGSGVPVGTEYHWYILAHQHVRKLNANDYTTSMTGVKFKLAHKRFDKEQWSTSDKAQKKKLIKILQDTIADLQKSLEADKEKKGKRAPSASKQDTAR